MAGIDLDGIRQTVASAATADRAIVERSWSGNFLDSIKGVAFGLVLVPVALALLFYMEGQAIVAADALAEARDLVVEGQSDTVNAETQGRLVHLSGTVTQGGLADGALGVSARGLVLNRHVEMMQWQETRRDINQNGNRQIEVSYKKVWSATAIDSRHFEPGLSSGHENPPMAFAPLRIAAKDAALGAFALSSKVVEDLSDLEPIPPTAEMATSIGTALARPARMMGDAIFVGADSNLPAVGDLRIRYELGAPASATAVARQEGRALVPYVTSNGGSVAILRAGDVPAGAMFTSAEAENDKQRWLYRAIGISLLFLGFVLILRPIAVLVEAVPILGALVSGGTTIGALLLTLLLAPLAIGLAWLAYAPSFSILVIGLGVASVMGLRALIDLVRRQSVPAK
jgi:hypothetical protein